MLLLILAICILFSGCVEENKIARSNESVHQEPVNITTENLSSITLSSKEENIPEIDVRSFSSIYTHTNLGKEYKYLFCWDNVPGSGNQELLNYLEKIKEEETPNSPKDGINIIGKNHSLIVKSDDNKTIRVYFTSQNDTELTLENRKKIVFLKTPYDIELEQKEVNGNCKVLITPQNVELEGKEVDGKLCIYKVEEKGYNITEKYYAVYNLSIKNNDSKSFDFKLSDLNMSDGSQIFNATTKEPENLHSCNIVSDLEKETKLEDTTLSPGQTINGSVVFQVNSLYDKSFLLIYNRTPISSASFQKCIKALSTAENYNYSVAFGKSPYTDSSLESPFDPSRDVFEPKPESYQDLIANWVNRKVFEFFNKYDSESVRNSSQDHICETETIYALKVIPERNLIMHPKTRSSEYYHLVVDDTGEELINRSYFSALATFGNESCNCYKYASYPPQMNFSNAILVRISYRNLFNTARMSLIDQFVILDDKLNMTVAAYNGGTFYH